MFPTVFILLYVAHHLADYPLQTDHQASHKADRGWAGWRANLIHAGTHVATSAVLLAAGTAHHHPDQLRAGIALAWIGLSHSLIDRRRGIAWWMRHTGQTDYLARGGAQHVDQTAHLAALLIAATIAT